MPNAAETIENLARKLERVRILNDLRPLGKSQKP